MHVEECSQALLRYVLPEIDQSRNGLCIDVGVGTFAFYCELFARTGFDTVAVEPLPTPELVRRCRLLNINLIEACISDKDGTESIYVGTYKGSENLNLSSLRSDWWGASSRSVQVRTMTLDSLLTTIKARLITCLKLDVEGMESVIIEQLQYTPVSLLPAVVMFEYGGGGTRQNSQAGWSEAYIDGSLACFRILKKLRYKTTILLDSSSESNERVIDMAKVNVLPDILFHPRSIYGNAICFLKEVSDTTWIEHICSLYRDNDLQPPQPLPPMGRSERWQWRLRSAMRRCRG